VRRWVDIEEKYIKGVLPNSHEFIDVSENAKRKPLVQNDLKPLYGLRSEDIDHLADLVESKKKCVKSSMVKKEDKLATMVTLMAAGQHERLIRVMKNELMKHELLSKKATYFPYSKESYDSFAKSMKITRTEIEHWVDRALASTTGKKWLNDRTKGLNKSSDPNDCPSWVHNMWSSHIYATGESTVIECIKTK
jgi:hypothetical protein